MFECLGVQIQIIFFAIAFVGRGVGLLLEKILNARFPIGIRRDGRLGRLGTFSELFFNASIIKGF